MKPEQVDEKIMPLSGHLQELRRRILLIAIAIFSGTALGLLFSKDIFGWLQKPLLAALPATSNFVALNPIEGWMVLFKTALITSLFATSPFWFYQLWAFLAPAIRTDHRRRLFYAAIFSSILFIGGGLICYFLIMPYGFEYFVSILNHTNIVLLPQIQIYLGFMIRIMIAFGLIFQMPLVLILLTRWNLVSTARLKSWRKYVVVFSFVAAAIITPPDVATQIIVALPLILLFEVSIILTSLFKGSRI